MTDEYQGGIEVHVVLVGIVDVVLGRLSLVHHVEVETRTIGLDGLDEGFESILNAAFGQRSATT